MARGAWQERSMIVDRPENAATNVTAAPPARRWRRRTRGLVAGGVMVLAIAAIYVVGLIDVLFKPLPSHQNGHGRTGLIIVLALLAVLCLAISLHLFRLARAASAIGPGIHNRSAKNGLSDSH